MRNSIFSLTEKQIHFVDEYILDFNGTRAAKAAGYSARTANEQAARLLAKVSVQKEIQTRLSRRELDYKEITNKVLNNLLEIATADASDCFFEDTCGGLYLKPLSELPHAIQTLAVSGNGDKIIVNMADRMKALELLGRHLGLFSENRVIKVIMNSKDRKARIERIQMIQDKLGFNEDNENTRIL